MKLLLWILSGHAATCMVAAGANQVFSNPIVPEDPVAAGKELVSKLLCMQPAEGVTNIATLAIRPKNGTEVSVPLRIEVSVTDSNWTTTYIPNYKAANQSARFSITKTSDAPNEYRVQTSDGCSPAVQSLSGQDAVLPLANSDFSLADLGMEFLHWPVQRLLKKEVRRSQSCDKLESIAPPGWTKGYVRVLSWFDIDTGGPVIIEAYDAKGRMVKEFKPNDFKKVNGQYQVEEIEMNSFQPRSRSSIRFDLEPANTEAD